MKEIDVIIPVYRGLEETKDCIESASRSMPDNSRLIVVNDCSPEPELSVWLRNNKTKYRYELHENTVNLGFVATVNFAMSLHKERDVLLLNSDVEVANDWLQRIQHVAYLADDIGSVTPFSNNATICSYPNFCQDNELAMQKTLTEIDKVCSIANSPDDYIEIPTGVGFCMFIKRSCLNDVGLFDVETFGKGYGEENDWCQRAFKLGWKNVHATNVFVYHKGGVSFADEQHPRQQVALELLLKKHPSYTADVMAFVAEDPAKLARIKFAIELVRHTKKTVLHVEHSLGGGVDRHVSDLVNYIEPDVVSVRLKQKNNIVSLKVNESNTLDFCIDTDYDLLMDTLKYLSFSIVHFHHIHGLDERLLNLPSTLSLDYFLTVHDYYLLNGNPALSDADGVFFGDEGESVVVEKSKSNQLSGYKYGDLRGKKILGAFIYGAKKVIFPSNDTMKRFCRFYEVLGKSEVAYHIEPYNYNSLKLPSSYYNSGRIRVLVIGAISLEKGAKILNKVAKMYSEKIELHILGYSCIPLPSNVVDHGAYLDSELPRKILSVQPTLVWYTSQCAETYCYTLSPSIALGIPIVAPAIGAFSERLETYERSILINDYANEEEVYSAFLEMSKKQTSYDIKASRVETKASYYGSSYVLEIIEAELQCIELDSTSLSLLLSKANEKTTISKESTYRLLLRLYNTRIGKLVSFFVPTRYLRVIKRKIFG